MIWLLRRINRRPTEFAPAMEEGTGILPGLPPVAGKPVHLAFDGGLMTSDAGILLLAAVEQRLGIAQRLADCIEDPRAPERVRHTLAEMIRYRALLIAAGYPDGNDCDALKSDPAFKMAVGRLPESGADLCSQPTIGYIFGLAGNAVLLRRVGGLAEDAALGRIDGEADKVRRYGDLRYAATSWNIERRVIARVEAGPQGADSRFIVTNLAGLPKSLYEKVYCARGQAENLIKAHKLHLASDRTSCTKATANQFRLLIHTTAYWLMLTLRGL